MPEHSQDVRRHVRALIKRRGLCKYSVWTGFASKGQFKFSLGGTPNVLHLIWMEGDPDVLEYRIPSHVDKDLENSKDDLPDAICVMSSGEVEWRKIKPDGVAEELLYKKFEQKTPVSEHSAKWRLITSKDLAQHATLIKNWRRGLAYMWAAAQYDLYPYIYDIRIVLKRDKPMSLKQILDVYPTKNEPLLIAAIFQLAQKLEIETDLAEKQFGFDTIVRGR